MGLERLGIFFDPNTTSFLIRLEKCNSWLPRSPDALSSSHGGERGIVKTIGWWSLPSSDQQGWQDFGYEINWGT